MIRTIIITFAITIAVAITCFYLTGAATETCGPSSGENCLLFFKRGAA